MNQLYIIPLISFRFPQVDAGHLWRPQWIHKDESFHGFRNLKCEEMWRVGGTFEHPLAKSWSSRLAILVGSKTLLKCAFFPWNIWEKNSWNRKDRKKEEQRRTGRKKPGAEVAAQRQGVCVSVEVPSIKPRYHKGNDVTTNEPLDTPLSSRLSCWIRRGSTHFKMTNSLTNFWWPEKFWKSKYL